MIDLELLEDAIAISDGPRRWKIIDVETGKVKAIIEERKEGDND